MPSSRAGERQLVTPQQSGLGARIILGSQPSAVRMPNTLDALEAEALKLTPQERLQLADRLIASVFQGQEVEALEPSMLRGASRRFSVAAQS